MFTAIAFVLLVASWWTNFTTYPFHVDTGCYLNWAERIHEGWVPHRDCYLGYTPLGMYYFSLFSGLSLPGQISYRVALLLVQLGSAALLYALSGGLIRSRTLRVAAAVFFLFMTQVYDGRLIMLEDFVVFFGLLTVLLLLKTTAERPLPAFLTGVALFLAVFSKQYGVLFVPVVAVMMWFDRNGRRVTGKTARMRLLLVGLGFLIPFIAYVEYVGIGLVPLLVQLSGRGYGTNGLFSMADRLSDIRLIWFVCVAIISIVILRRRFRFDLFVITLTFLLTFSPLVVRGCLHYFLLMLPYGVLLLAYAFEYYFISDERPRRSPALKVLILAVCVSLFMAAFNNVHHSVYYASGDEGRKFLHDTVGMHKTTFHEDQEIAERINRTFPPGTPVMMIGFQQFSYLSGFYPPNRDVGYVFYRYDIRDRFDLSKIDNIVVVNIGLWSEAGEIIDELRADHEVVDSFPSEFYGTVELWRKK